MRTGASRLVVVGRWALEAFQLHVRTNKGATKRGPDRDRAGAASCADAAFCRAHWSTDQRTIPLPSHCFNSSDRPSLPGVASARKKSWRRREVRPTTDSSVGVPLLALAFGRRLKVAATKWGTIHLPAERVTTQPHHRLVVDPHTVLWRSATHGGRGGGTRPIDSHERKGGEGGQWRLESLLNHGRTHHAHNAHAQARLTQHSGLGNAAAAKPCVACGASLLPRSSGSSKSYY